MSKCVAVLDKAELALHTLQPIRSTFGRFLFVILAHLALVGHVPSVSAEAAQADVVIIGNDRGGSLRDRIAQIREIERSGQRVAVTGRICYSTCTMFLGLPQACISPDTMFGFHGPSSYGRPLAPAVFDQASGVIADHYPDALRQWYMTTARHSIAGLYRIRGSDIIRLGVESC